MNDELNELMQLLSDGALEFKDELSAIVSLDDEEFTIIAQPLRESFEREFKDENMVRMLVLSMQQNGISIETFDEMVDTISDSLNEANISPIKRDWLISILCTMRDGINKYFNLKTVTVGIEVLEDGKVPSYAHDTDACFDIYCAEDFTLGPGESKRIHTGIKVAIPKGYEMTIRPRSGISAKTRMRICNTPGTIDAGYRDELMILVENIDPPIRNIHARVDENGTQLPVVMGDIEYGQSISFTKGDRIAQGSVQHLIHTIFNPVSDIRIYGDDRNGGFGSTGLK